MDCSQQNTQLPIIIDEEGKEDGAKYKEQNHLKAKDRKRKSKVWLEFTVITLDDGSQKAKCNHCSTLIAINSQGSTTQFHRHLESCLVRLAATKQQRLLAFQPLGPTDFGGGSGGTITTYKYDKDKDGLQVIRTVIGNIRESVKYLKMSPSRLHRFTEIVKQLQLPTSKGLILDVPTRWNSTYAMLQSAIVFKEVFPRYKERDPHYQWLPSSDDWDRATEVCNLLETFSDATHIFSGVNYPTSNLFLPEVWKIRQILNEKSGDGSNEFVQILALRMREKFDKYWGDCNLLMAIGAVLDPRYKMRLIEFCYKKVYLSSKAVDEIELVRCSLHELYAEYMATSTSDNVRLVHTRRINSSNENIDARGMNKSKGITEFQLWAQELDTIVPSKSELDIYLEEGLYVCKEGLDTNFDVLDWWKANTLKFRVLSCMARDILSIPMTTVASESAFSAGGRVLDQYRSSLKPETVQALVCTGDWLRSDWKIAKSLELDDEDMQQVKFE